MLFGLVLLVGCGGTPGAPSAAEPAPTTAGTTTPGPPPATGTPSPSAEAAEVVEITLADGRAEPNGERVQVAKGTTLELVITSDRHDSVHVHGYEVEIAVQPGATVRKRIVLDRVGRYEVESHEPVLTILQLIVS
jgi:hypothetical protein